MWIVPGNAGLTSSSRTVGVDLEAVVHCSIVGMTAVTKVEKQR